MPVGRGLISRPTWRTVRGDQDTNGESLPDGPDTNPDPPRPLLWSPILVVRSGGAGAAANVTLGERSLRRGYAEAEPRLGYAKRGSTRQTTSRTQSFKSLANPLGVTKGKGCVLMNGQMNLGFGHGVRPTLDSIHLARRIDARWGTADLSPAGLQNLVKVYGERAVEDALRQLHGFPPEEAIRSPYAYLKAMLNGAD